MKMVAVIALAVALGLAWMGVAIPQETKPGSGETVTDKLKSAGEKVKAKAIELKDKAKEKLGGAGAGADTAEVKAAQQALRDKGYDPGPADGMMGPRTRAAVRDFQRQEGLTVTGRLDGDTMARLGAMEPSASPSTAPPATRPRR